MFDFEKLEVYQDIRTVNKTVLRLIGDNRIDPFIRDQLKRATLSIALNTSEGAGRFSKKDKRHFYVMARSSLFESVSLLDSLLDIKSIDVNQHNSIYASYEVISKRLMGLIRSCDR